VTALLLFVTETALSPTSICFYETRTANTGSQLNFVKAREGRNPQTGASIRIPASKTVGFKAGKAGKALKDAVC